MKKAFRHLLGWTWIAFVLLLSVLVALPWLPWPGISPLPLPPAPAGW